MTKKLAGTPSRRKVSRIKAAPRLSAPPSKVNATTLAEVGRTLTTDAVRGVGVVGADVVDDGVGVEVVRLADVDVEVVGLADVDVDGLGEEEVDADVGCAEGVLVGGHVVLDGTTVAVGTQGSAVAVAVAGAVGLAVDEGARVPGPVLQPATSAINAPTSASLARIVLTSLDSSLQQGDALIRRSVDPVAVRGPGRCQALGVRSSRPTAAVD